MAWCPFAIRKPLRENATQQRITPRAIILHTAVSNVLSLFDFFQNNSNLESHFYVREDGVIEQYMDTEIMADANKNANEFAVSIETWDGGTIRPWTALQVTALIRLCDWLCDKHGIPRVQIPTANGAGIGWHVMFGAPGPWTPVAKSCPGGPRIQQTQQIIIPQVRKAGEPMADTTPAEFWGYENNNSPEVRGRDAYQLLVEAARNQWAYKNPDVAATQGRDAYAILVDTNVKMSRILEIVEGLQ